MNLSRILLTTTVCTLLVSAVSSNAFAAGKKGGKSAFAGGSISIGLGISSTSADQTGINGLVDSAKAATNSTASKLTSGTEYIGTLTFRFSNNWVALQLRPTLFSQSSSGSGSDGAHEYKLDGYTIFPLIRMIPLSNDMIDFYIQGGLGYGKLSGTVKNGATSASFDGSTFGMQIGIGADFCFIPSHCFGVEGNYRYMPISRNIVSSSSGLPTGVSQAPVNGELESGNSDVATTLSGISGILTYTYSF